MNIHEYQAKELLRRSAVPVPEGYVAWTAEEAVKAASKLPGPVFAVKSQIHAGGRGAGRFADGKRGIRLVRSLADVRAAADEMIGQTLVTKQTGPAGRVVRRLYIEAGCDIERELYLALLVDRPSGRIAIIGSTAGGMDIETVAHDQPDAIKRLLVDPAVGLSDFHGRRLAADLQLHGCTASAFGRLLAALYKTFIDFDCAMIEINPLVVTKAGDVMALDAKIAFDDNALFRHPDLGKLRDEAEVDPKELEAEKYNLNYVALDGNIGCMVNGAGLAMATMDLVKLHGMAPANFLDVGGGATRERVTAALRIILSDPNVEGILVNIFGGIMRCDVIADGIIAAASDVQLSVPLVVRLEGTNVALGRDMLSRSNLPIIPADTLADAAEKIVAAVKNAA